MSDPNAQANSKKSASQKAASGNDHADRLSVDRGSGNVFADLGIADANAMAMKSGLAMRLADLIKRRGLTQAQAAQLTDISQPDLSRILRGNFRNFSSDRMVRALTLLSADVEITIYTDGHTFGEPIRLHSAGAAVTA
jgi:predicted XRE-type DNA-binding protein